MLNFKEKLIKLRKDNNLTQDELAKKLKISRSAVANYEKITISKTIDLNLRKYLRDTSERILGRKITPHVLRHTHASLLAEQGLPYEAIAHRL